MWQLPPTTQQEDFKVDTGMMLCAFLAAVGFSWPILSNYAATATPFWVNILVATGSIAFAGGMVGAGKDQITAITRKDAGILIGCGLLNGFGIANYSKLFSAPQYIPVALALTPAFIRVGMWLCHGKELNWINITGIAALGPVIWAITYNK